jgi:hypothetical protein
MSKGKEKPAHEGKSVGVDQVTSMRPNKAANKTKDVTRQKKRKAFVRHPDAPLSSSLKRQKLTYDDDEAAKPDRDSHGDETLSRTLERQKVSYDNDEATKGDRGGHGDQTCFFWYHDNCARSQEPRTNYHCFFRHGLTDPPSMVKPPPGYVHRKPCELELCPGDASKDNGDRDKRYFEGKTKEMQVELISMDKVDQERDWYLSGFDDC